MPGAAVLGHTMKIFLSLLERKQIEFLNDWPTENTFVR